MNACLEHWHFQIYGRGSSGPCIYVLATLEGFALNEELAALLANFIIDLRLENEDIAAKISTKL
jgi:hypothetical protein